MADAADTSLSLTFHRSLYLPAGVQAAVEAYGPYCTTIDVSETESDLVVTLKGFHSGYADMLGDAFANHALFETVVRARETLGGVPV
jgi:hypothetical protein